MAKDLALSIQAAEADYTATLIAALRRCAAGTWGLFGHNDAPEGGRYKSAEAEKLRELGEDICAMRARAGLDRFALHDAFEAARGRPGNSNAVGEPKQAKEWLARLGQT